MLKTLCAPKEQEVEIPPAYASAKVSKCLVAGSLNTNSNAFSLKLVKIAIESLFFYHVGCLT